MCVQRRTKWQSLSHEAACILVTWELIHVKTADSVKHKVIITAVVSVNNKITSPSNHGSQITGPSRESLEICTAGVLCCYSERGCSQRLQTSRISGIGEVEMPGNIGNIIPQPFNLTGRFFLGYLHSVSTSASAGPHQPQLGGHHWTSGKGGFSPQIGGSMWAKYSIALS